MTDADRGAELKCFRCGKTLSGVGGVGNQPSGGAIAYATGNYGSTVVDAFMDGEVIRFYVCDECLTGALDAGTANPPRASSDYGLTTPTWSALAARSRAERFAEDEGRAAPGALPEAAKMTDWDRTHLPRDQFDAGHKLRDEIMVLVHAYNAASIEQHEGDEHSALEDYRKVDAASLALETRLFDLGAQIQALGSLSGAGQQEKRRSADQVEADAIERAKKNIW